MTLPDQPLTVWPPKPVLVVDDDAPSREAVSRMVRGLGYRVRAARSGAEAMRIVRRKDQEPGLVLTRLLMSPMDGGELAERIRDATPGARVVLLLDSAQEGGELVAAYPELPRLRLPPRLGDLYGLLTQVLGPPVLARARRPVLPRRFGARPRNRPAGSEE